MSEREKGREGKGRCGESQLTMRGGLTARIRCDKRYPSCLPWELLGLSSVSLHIHNQGMVRSPRSENRYVSLHFDRSI